MKSLELGHAQEKRVPPFFIDITVTREQIDAMPPEQELYERRERRLRQVT